MNKECNDIEIAISEMTLGKVSTELEQQIHAHIAECESCMGFYLSMAETFGPQDEKGDEQGLSTEQKMAIFAEAQKIDAAVQENPPQEVKKFSWNIVLSVAAALIVSGIILFPALKERSESAYVLKSESQELKNSPAPKSIADEKDKEVSVVLEEVREMEDAPSESQQMSRRSRARAAEVRSVLKKQKLLQQKKGDMPVVTTTVIEDSFADDAALADLTDEVPSTEDNSLAEAVSDIVLSPNTFPKTKKENKKDELSLSYSNRGISAEEEEMDIVAASSDRLKQAKGSNGSDLGEKRLVAEKKRKLPLDKMAVARKEESKLDQSKDTLNSQRRAMLDTAQNLQSTFSVDVDTAGYQIAKTQISNNITPDPQVLRAEEFINYQNYNYKAPQKETFNIETAVADSPFHRGNQIMHIGIQGRRPGGDHRKPSHFCFIVDTSGSMAADGRLPLIKKVLPMIVKQMTKGDKVSLLAGGLKPQLILDKVDVADLEQINQKVSSLNAVGATNLEANVLEGYAQVESNTDNAYNRVVLMSDGVANLGEVSAQNILKNLESSRDKGVGITVIGMGQGEYNDNFLEQLANKGDGNYVYIDDSVEAQKSFEEKFAATFHTIAKNVKIQVDFDPQQVAKYRLLGYENRRLKNEDFRNDKVDAGEVGSGQAVTAIYEMELTGHQRDVPLAVVNMRYNDVRDNQMKEQQAKVMNLKENVEFNTAPNSLRLAFLAGKYAEVLQQGGVDEGITINHLLKYMRPLASEMNNDSHVQEMLFLMNKSK